MTVKKGLHVVSGKNEGREHERFLSMTGMARFFFLRGRKNDLTGCTFQVEQEREHGRL